MVYNIYMRIITGKYKGRKLVAPKTQTRPTLDRAKETLFNMLGNLVGKNVLDLFAGSGQIALECLSRGASRAVVCDSGKDAVAAITENFEKLGLKAELFRCEYSQCLRTLASTNARFDLVYVDPPYQSGLYLDVLRLVQQLDLLSDDGVVVCEHPAQMHLPQNVDSLCVTRQRKVGTVNFSFYTIEQQADETNA